MTVDGTGYLHRAYADSLSAFGTPRQLPRSGGWLLERAIADSDACDAMGCYPILCCRDWDGLGADLDALGHQLVSVTAVSDPFGACDEASLRRSFQHVRPFKEHFVAELSPHADAAISAHHRYYARLALAALGVTEWPDPATFLDGWVELYEVLVHRHSLRGIKAFGREAFARQLRVPGVRLFVAEHDGHVAGAQIWYVQGDVAYNHLQASSDAGYQLGAAYALYMTAIRGLAADVRWLHIGAGPGSGSAHADGLARFKSGWASGTRTAYLCGRVLDAAGYADVCRRAGVLLDDARAYFPAYRVGELL